jgi:hypothetical protein
MKKVFVFLFVLLIGCNNNSVKCNKIILEEKPLIVEINDKNNEKNFSSESKKPLIEKINNNSVTVEKVSKKKIIRKKILDASYTEYIFK